MACRLLIKCKKFTTERHGVSLEKTNHESPKGRKHEKGMNNNQYKEFYLENVEDKKQKYQFEELSKKIIGAAIEVHRELGPGF